MDTKAGEIIVQAFSEGGFKPRGNSSIAEEMQEALPVLNSLLFSLVGVELGEQYRDWPVPPNRRSPVPSRYPLGPIDETPDRCVWANPPINSRILAANDTDVTVYFPANPRDGARMAYADVGANACITMDGNGRLIQGLPTIQGAGGSVRWLYRSDLGNWICLHKLEIKDEVPLPQEFDDLLITGLVTRLSPRFGAEVSPWIADRYRDMLSRLKKRYRQTEAMPAAKPHEFPRLEI